MQLHSKNINTGGNHRVWLYSTVFAGKLSMVAIFVLLLSFMIQPFHQALANEAEAEANPEPALPAEVEEQLDEPEPEPEEIEIIEEAPETEVEVEEDVQVDDTEDTETEANIEVQQTVQPSKSSSTQTVNNTSSENQNTTSAPTSTTQTSSSKSTSTDISVSTTTPEATESTSSASSDTVATTSTENNASTTESGSGGGTSDSVTDEVVDDLVDEPADVPANDSSSNNENTPEEEDDFIDNGKISSGVNSLVDEVVNEVVTLTRQMVTEENYYQFSRQSCVAVGDGTFHCTMKDRLVADPDSAVYAEADSEGDLEIYMRTSKGEVKQLTDNSYDDSSPDLDLASMRVVWQRMIDGRYQIISYDLEERKETQLTFSRTNSMEPKVAKEGVVWQAWDGNDWEILYFDGQFTDQLTDNDIQDVTPVIEDGYILWSVLGGEESEARVYSIESGEVMTISGTDGGTVVNPRFVLVYDTKFDNGDIVTQGFDPVTGLAKPIAAQPAELPFDIPEPDPVGEIRALIQNKSSNDKKDVVTVPTADSDGDLNLTSTTATSSDTLNLFSTDFDDTSDIPAEPPEPDFELTEYDLVITNDASSTASALNDEFEITGVPDQTASSTLVE